VEHSLRVEAVSAPTVTRIGDGIYRVEDQGRVEIVYVAGTADDRWAFWNGQVFRSGRVTVSRRAGRSGQADTAQALTAPMPATVVSVRVQPGSAIKKGDTVVILEAMKMELPIRSPADATVTAVHCREGELVQPDSVLVELS
jgi:acetyl/propionyl-CoA carboxylase alpha subunit